MKAEYEIIIIGAGPAGLECAAGLAGSGKSVLLIEKNDVIGPKICGGGLTSLAQDFDVPVEMTDVFNSVELEIGGRSLNLELKKPIRTLSRYDLGQHQLSKVKSCKDIEITTGLKVNSIDKEKIVTEKGNINYKFLVGADGSGSIVRKFLNLKNDNKTGLLYQVDNAQSNFKWIVNPKKLGSGYMWIFPNKTGINTGIFFDQNQIKPAEAKKTLDDHLSFKGIKFDKDEIKSGKINCKYSGISFGNIFVAGDAAGLALKSTGEGIPGALISGREISGKILNSEYKMPKLRAYLKIKKRRETLLYIFELFPFMQMFFFNLYSVYKRHNNY